MLRRFCLRRSLIVVDQRGKGGGSKFRMRFNFRPWGGRISSMGAPISVLGEHLSFMGD